MGTAPSPATPDWDSWVVRGIVFVDMFVLGIVRP